MEETSQNVKNTLGGTRMTLRCRILQLDQITCIFASFLF